MPIHVERWSETSPPDAQELRTHLKSEGYSVSESILAPAEYLSPHSSYQDQSYWILSGELRLEVDYQEVYTLGAGDRGYVPASAMRSLNVLGDVPVVYLVGDKREGQQHIGERQRYIGEIRIFSGDFVPQGWAICNGQLLLISSYQPLFSLIGITYGGDGESTFALPDLQNCVPMHQGGGRSIGETGSVGFTETEFDYSHLWGCGVGSGHSVMNYMISLSGAFPSSEPNHSPSEAAPFLAEGRIFAFNFTPNGWAPCDGQLLPLGGIDPSQNTRIFSLLGTTYGGDNSYDEDDPDPYYSPTFALPNLGGSIAPHDPSARGNSAGQEDDRSVESFDPNGRINYLVVNFCIALEGEYPLRPDTIALAPEEGSTAAERNIAEIRMFFGNFAPIGWGLCEGQLMPIPENQETFSLIGRAFDSYGKATFAFRPPLMIIKSFNPTA